MGSLNRVTILGNLGQDPELKHLPSGQAVCNLRIATTDMFKDKAGVRQERTEWHSVVVFGASAENCAKYLAKGRTAAVDGSLRTRSWEDKATGAKRYATEIVADRVVFVGGSKGGGAREEEEHPGVKAARDAFAPPSDDDIPF